ncbi:MAG: DUF885 family protein, partial [Novosphingobium sp.]
MKRFALLAALPLAALAFAQLPADAAKPARHAMRLAKPDEVFKSIASQFIAATLQSSPIEATALGEHKYDGLLPDINAKGRADRRQTWQGFLTRLDAINPARLSRDNQVDMALLKNELQYRL